MKKLVFFAMALNSSILAFSIPCPGGVYDQVLKHKIYKGSFNTNLSEKLKALGFDKSAVPKFNEFNKAINSHDGRLVGVKFTLAKELGSSGPIKKLNLSGTLKDRAAVFMVDYRLFMEFLHAQVYAKVRISKLEIPSVLFFRDGQLVLPIEPWEIDSFDQSGERLEALVREHLDRDDSVPDFESAIFAV